MKKLSFAIVGGGPAGFYTAKLLSKLPCNPQVHIYQKQLCPFGLIRYGVAPDHVSIKRSQLVLSQIDKYQGFHYIGNSPITTSKLSFLREQYSGVIFSIGASGDSVPTVLQQHQSDYVRKKYPNLKLAREIVYWYNNHPEFESYKLDLTNVRDVTIVGNGNVAVDIARIFLRKTEELALTEISHNALEMLKQSSVENVTIVGRRGVVQSAFALKEIRELTKCNIKLYAIKSQLQSSLNDASHHECTALGDHFSNLIRLNKRKVDFVKNNVTIIEEKDLEKIMKNKEKKVILRFLLNPQQIKNNDRLEFNKTYLQGEPFKQKAVDTDEVVDIHHDLLIYSTGFQVRNIDGSKPKANRISNSDGCLINDEEEKIFVGNYVSGWCKTGPQGVIDQTLLGCEETFNNIRIHLENHVLQQKTPVKIDDIFDSKINSSWQQYKNLRQIQLKRGNESKFIKKKLNKKQTLQLYGLNL